MLETYESVLKALLDACLTHYGERLLSVAVFGSVARGTPRRDSDVDLLIVADPLPRGRLARMDEFAVVEKSLAGLLEQGRRDGFFIELSPVFKTPAELEVGSLLLLDMTDQARILFDRDGILRARLDRLAEKLRRWGSRRVRRGGGYYWLLKPDLKPGERLEL